MKAVGLRELKNRLSEFVRQVRAGEGVLVTDRGEVVAELRPPGQHVRGAALPPGVAALAARGLLSPGAPNDPALYPALSGALPPATVARLLDQERRER